MLIGRWIATAVDGRHFVIDRENNCHGELVSCREIAEPP
jgi:hypothetical protein